MRLKNVVQDYENQIAALHQGSGMSDRANFLRQLKDQGEKIRQDTLSLLRGKSSTGMLLHI
jgi:hypothetical protein